MTSTEIKTVYVGDEYDDRVRIALREVMAELGAKVLSHRWGVAGSQEVETLEAELRGAHFTIEAETYVGLSLTGPGEIVDLIAEWVAERSGVRP